jgi:glutamyl-tRNA reductase
MTLIEIEQKTRVPKAYLIENLGMPKDVQLDEGVAKLGKSFGFEIDDVRRIVRKYKAQE